ncbi:MAG: EAL domain-containing protein [Telmatospirillum sp.]|nr:EAL domain-containing protein [Telmatospirillum sp.]
MTTAAKSCPPKPSSDRVASPSAWRLADFAPFALAALITAAALAVLVRIDGLEQSHWRDVERGEVVRDLDTVRSRLELSLTAPLLRTLGVAAYISARGDISKSEFAAVARVVLEGNRNIRDMVVSRGTVIAMVYPEPGNEAAIGIDFRNLPLQWPSVARSISSRQPGMNGPVKLVQGGTALIVRHPIYLPDQAGPDRFFGIVGIALDIPGIFSEAGLTRSDRTLDIAIRGSDGLGSGGDVIFGDPHLFATDAVQMDVLLPNGTLRLAGRPKEGWTRNGSFRMVGAVLLLFVAGVSFGTAIHITMRERARRTLIESEERFRATFEQVAVGVIHTAFDGSLIRCNRRFADMVGYSPEELSRMHYEDVTHPEDSSSARDIHRRLVEGGLDNVICEKRYQRRNGSFVWARARTSVLRDATGAPLHVVTVAEDITERKAQEAEIRHLAFFDILTGLPNRRLFLDRLTETRSSDSDGGTFGALIFVDLDNFKTLNDTQGHRIGDMLLTEVGERLRRSVRAGDTVARLGGDEFVVMLDTLGPDRAVATGHARDVADDILARLAEPYRLEGHVHYSSASIGIALFQGAESSNDDLLKQADVAMYHAKSAGRNTLRFFDPAMQDALSARAELEADLRRAVEQREFCLYYQPQVDAAGRVIGAEGLIRWQHPRRGLVPPGEFIPVAELSDLILPIGRQVVDMACAELAAWQKRPETRNLVLSINVSARQLRQNDFVGEIRDVLARSGIDPAGLKMELTESVLLQDLDDCADKMALLRGIGMTLSLDDFGTGYSSLAYLKRLPLSQIKIDRSFVNDVLVDPNDATIARAIIALGKSLGLSVIAEGVEQREQWRFLQAEGCDQAQGYLFGRPMPARDFLALATTGTGVLAAD